MIAPVITIFVRHSEDCKYRGDEFSRRCKCRKHLRWTLEGKQHRRQAGTRSWEEAEEKKRELIDQLTGKAPAPEATYGRDLQECISLFIQDKQVQGISADVIAKYVRELARLRTFCEASGVFIIGGVTRELLTSYAGTWEKQYPSSQTRAMVKARTRSFLRYCYEAQWLARIPALPKIKVDEPPTLPLTDEEFTRLLASVPRATRTITDPDRIKKVRALILLMRWSGLSLRDALKLPRAEMHKRGNLYKVVTNRQKTGTDVSVPLPPDVAKEILAVPNDNDLYFFWDGDLDNDIVKTWTKYYIPPVFEAANITSDGYMVSHRLRDTFAVSLLEKGVPLEEVSKLLGHKSIKTTERHYAKWVQARQDRLDALVVGTW